MASSLSAQTIATVKASGPALRDHGPAIAEALYDSLLQHPEIRPMFDPGRQGKGGAQPNALARALVAYAENIDNLPALGAAVETISQKHASSRVRPEHYQTVAVALFDALEKVLGAAASAEVLQAWDEAYWFLANIMIAREEEIGRASRAAEGGWSGLRDFSIVRRTKESETITSFEMRPCDGSAVTTHRAGQYLTLVCDVPGAGEHRRRYTISNAADGETYRISVKREPEGVVSRWLHDEAETGTRVRVAPPSGVFVLPDAPDRPIVLVSGGVGQTPMISMLETIASSFSDLETYYIHSTQDRSTHAFAERVRALAAARPNFHVTTFYTRQRESEAAAAERAGRMEVGWLIANTPVHEADYYVCGPVPVLRTVVAGLAERGVPRQRVHYEFFGSAEELVVSWPDSGEYVPSDAQPAARPSASRAAEKVDRSKVAEAVMTGASDAVVVSDRDGIITLWNPGAERIFGFSPEEAVGQSLDIIVPEALRGRHWEGYRETVASGQSRYGAGDLLAVPGLHKSGKRISLEFTIALMKEGDEVSGMVAVMRDVTRRFEEVRDLRKRIADLTP